MWSKRIEFLNLKFITEKQHKNNQSKITVIKKKRSTIITKNAYKLRRRTHALNWTSIRFPTFFKSLSDPAATKAGFRPIRFTLIEWERENEWELYVFRRQLIKLFRGNLFWEKI